MFRDAASDRGNIHGDNCRCIDKATLVAPRFFPTDACFSVFSVHQIVRRQIYLTVMPTADNRQPFDRESDRPSLYSINSLHTPDLEFQYIHTLLQETGVRGGLFIGTDNGYLVVRSCSTCYLFSCQATYCLYCHLPNCHVAARSGSSFMCLNALRLGNRTHRHTSFLGHAPVLWTCAVQMIPSSWTANLMNRLPSASTVPLATTRAFKKMCFSFV